VSGGAAGDGGAAGGGSSGGSAGGGSAGGGGGGGAGGALTSRDTHSQQSSQTSPVDASNSPSNAISIAGVSTGVLANVAASGGQFSYDQLSVDVPAGAVGGTIQITRVDPSPGTPQGFQVGRTYSLTFTDSSSGAPIAQLAQPWAVEYRVSTDDMTQSGGDVSRVRLATLSGDGSWVAADCTASGTALECYLPHLSVIAALVIPPVGDVLDSPLPGGWFFKQANGFNGAGDNGFSVVDDADASLWSEFQRLGGVDRLGYPVSQRYLSDGLITQAFQRAILQWAPDAGQARLLNVMSLFTAAGLDGWLDQHRQVPPGGDTAADIAVLGDQPALRALFDADPGIASTYGLPLAVKSYNGLVTARLERGYLQLWTIDTPWAPAGTVTIGGAGELARGTGLLPTSALAPGIPYSAPASADATPDSSPGANDEGEVGL
jgi:hypothetical protein